MDHLRKIVRLALSRPLDERSGYLDIACGNNTNTRNEATKWLEAVTQDQHPENKKPPVITADWLQEGSLSGYRLGPYILEDEVGRGGMGLVYRAKRDDDEFQQEVAIKLMLPNAPENLMTRFLSERNILANLNHPYIARLYDGGWHNGQPYFVMEYVTGEPIDVYCNRHNLSIPQRVELFLKVLSAVRYAHQRPLVHRDLKPENILITKDGAPKLLDFGIAKLLDDENRQRRSLTKSGERAMTRDYASPEQIKELTVTTVSDIYTLGVLLFKLLSGLSPYRLERQTASHLEDAICHQEPEPPSIALSGQPSQPNDHTVSDKRGIFQMPENFAKRRRLLREDLDQIVLKALRKEPNERYASVAEFAADLRNHLNGLPVLARKGEKRYRAKKWLVRNRLYFSFGVVIFVGILSFAIVALMQSQQIARERDNATRERDKFSRIVDLTKDMFSAADPREARGDTVTAREILDAGAETVKSSLSDKPEIKAAFLTHLGEIYGQLGNFKRSKGLIDEALNIRLELYGENHVDVAESKFYLATQYWNDGNYDESIRYYREALLVYHQIGNFYDVAVTRGNIGLALMDKGELKDAEIMLRQAIADFDIAFPEPKKDKRYIDKFGLMNNLTMLLLAKQELEEANTIIQDILTSLPNHFPADHPRWTAVYSQKANLLNRQGKHAEAATYLHRALAIAQKALPEAHPEISVLQTALSLTLIHSENYQKASAMLAEAYNALQALVDRNVLEPDHVYIQNALTVYVRLYTALDKPKEAEIYQRKLIDLQDQSHVQANK